MNRKIAQSLQLNSSELQAGPEGVQDNSIAQGHSWYSLFADVCKMVKRYVIFQRQKLATFIPFTDRGIMQAETAYVSFQ